MWLSTRCPDEVAARLQLFAERAKADRRMTRRHLARPGSSEKHWALVEEGGLVFLAWKIREHELTSNPQVPRDHVGVLLACNIFLFSLVTFSCFSLVTF